MNWDPGVKVREFSRSLSPRARNVLISALLVVQYALLAFLMYGLHGVLRVSSLAAGLPEVIVASTASLLIALPIFLVTSQRLTHLESRERWLSGVTRFHFARLKEHGLIENDDGAPKGDANSRKWPWGEHHTEYLGHLEAAAEKWWVLYDPSDLTTAPTNEMVIEWLQSERNVSRERARAIASMLRPDGLPTGPRR